MQAWGLHRRSTKLSRQIKITSPLSDSIETLSQRRKVILISKDGPEGIRTLDLCVANAALSQLSYKPGLLTVKEYFSTLQKKIK